MKKNVCAILAVKGERCADELTQKLEVLFQDTIEKGYDEYMCGVERGAEQAAASALLSLRDRYPIKLCGLVDSEEQWLDWTLSERETLFSIMERADYECRVANSGKENVLALKLKLISEASSMLVLICSRLPREFEELARKMRFRGCDVVLFNPETLVESRYFELINIEEE